MNLETSNIKPKINDGKVKKELVVYKEIQDVYLSRFAKREKDTSRSPEILNDVAYIKTVLENFEISTTDQLEFADFVYSNLSFKGTDFTLILSLRLRIKEFLQQVAQSDVSADYFYRYSHPLVRKYNYYLSDYYNSLSSTESLAKELFKYKILQPLKFLQIIPKEHFQNFPKILLLIEFQFREWTSVTYLLSVCNGNYSDNTCQIYKRKMVS